MHANLGTLQSAYLLLDLAPLYAVFVLAEKLARLAVLPVLAAPVLDIVNVSFCPGFAARALDIAVLSY